MDDFLYPYRGLTLRGSLGFLNSLINNEYIVSFTLSSETYFRGLAGDGVSVVSSVYDFSNSQNYSDFCWIIGNEISVAYYSASSNMLLSSMHTCMSKDYILIFLFLEVLGFSFEITTFLADGMKKCSFCLICRNEGTLLLNSFDIRFDLIFSSYRFRKLTIDCSVLMPNI